MNKNPRRVMNTTGVDLDIPKSLQKCQIYQWLRGGEFWDKDFIVDILPQLKIEFGSELGHLKTAKADRKDVADGRKDTFAMCLYQGEDGSFTDDEGVVQDKATTYYEIDRTLTAVHALLWIRNDQVDTFNGELAQAEREALQDGKTTLEDRPWSWIRHQFMTAEANVFLPEQAHVCYGLITSVIINDLGKDVGITTAYEEHTGQKLEAANHDAILSACVDAGMVPSLDRLPTSLKKSIMLGIEVAAECNLGQMAQAENVPASLYALTRCRSDRVAWRLRFMEQIMDLAGAKGHVNNTCALVFTPAVARGNRYCHKVGEQLLAGIKPQAAYNTYLETRYRFLVEQCGYNPNLVVHNPAHRALMRIFCMAGCYHSSLAALCEHVLLESHYTTLFREELISALNEDGLARPAIQVTYLPALIDGVIRSDGQSSYEVEEGFASALEYANACLRMDDTMRDQWHAQGVTVVERDIFEASQWVKVGSAWVGEDLEWNGTREKGEFGRDPGLLATYRVPEAVVVNRVEPGFEEDFVTTG